MPRPFHRLSIADFIEVLGAFPFSRSITDIHLHHTWRPRHRDFRGLATIEGMYRHHTLERRFSDIAQHVTIDPQGNIWTGRGWNLPPASAVGFNGNRAAGPFMIEMIGDFDEQRDRLEGPQRDAALEVIARVQRRFGRLPDALRFHCEMADRSCPGTQLDREALVREVAERHRQVEARAAAGDGKPRDAAPFGRDVFLAREAIEVLARDTTAADPADAELEEAGAAHDAVRSMTGEPVSDGGVAGGRGGDFELTPERIDELRPHVINLTAGRFSSGGDFETTAQDVDAIFGEHLKKWQSAVERPLRIVLFAHGGLVSERAGLAIAHKHISWWKHNGIWPIYFIWETGLGETIRQLLSGSQRRLGRETGRDLFDVTSDKLLEATARALGGTKIWAGMKRSAELAAGKNGGARYAAERLVDFFRANATDGIELHAAGHSAGSIFHAHFVPEATRLGAVFSSVHLLAPAIRVDTFQRLLAPAVGDGVQQLTVYTMKKHYEKADQTGFVYRKSLLYLVHHALETQRRTPILGLEESLRGDGRVANLFGLGGTAAAAASVVWSKTDAPAGCSASTATSHGGFDDDPATMNSVARRILGLSDNDPRLVTYSAAREAVADEPLANFFERSEDRELLVELGETQRHAQPAPVAAPPRPAAPDALDAAPAPELRVDGAGGRRRALCVGIDDYSRSPLAGCVADARHWARTLAELGFETHLLLDRDATRDGMLGALRQLVQTGRAGDVLVFQYAGHGTMVPDASGDEREGDTPVHDEALVPYDYETGALLVDDDVAQVFDGLSDGVGLTCFMDCCHSGSISRFGVGAPRSASGARSRPRFIVLPEPVVDAYRRRRAIEAAVRGQRAPRGAETMREVLFSACRSSEVAYETDGHGEFTVRAAQLLREADGRLSHEEFQRQILSAFGERPRQHPELDCSPARRAHKLLAPLAGAPVPARVAVAPLAHGDLTPTDPKAVMQVLKWLATRVQPTP